MGNQQHNRRGALQSAARLAWGGQWAWKLAERAGTTAEEVRAMADGTVPASADVVVQMELELEHMAIRIARHRAALQEVRHDG